MPTRRALVVGAGVAGLATALRLCRSDWQMVLLERDHPTPGNRLPGALHGFGHDAAARLGLLPALNAVSRPPGVTTLIDAERTPLAIRHEPSVPVLRGDDVATVLREALGELESHRHTEVVALAQDDCGVTVSFSDGSDDWFDLVADADGPKSMVGKGLSLADDGSVTRRASAWTHADRWAQRQIALVGKATRCADVLWDHDISLAIGGAELLGDALDIFIDTAEALVWWENQMRRVVRRQSAMPREREVVEWNFPRTRSVR